MFFYNKFILKKKFKRVPTAYNLEHWKEFLCFSERDIKYKFQILIRPVNKIFFSTQNDLNENSNNNSWNTL